VHDLPDAPVGPVHVGPPETCQFFSAQAKADGQGQRRLGARGVPAPRLSDPEDVPDL